MAAPLGVVQFEGAPSSGRATVVRTVTRPAEAKGSLGSMPVLVNHASSLSPAEPCGPLIPSNVRPPQCPAISALGGAFVPTAMTGSPFFHAAPSAPFCRSPKSDAPTLANFQHLQNHPCWPLSSTPFGPPMYPFDPQNSGALPFNDGASSERLRQQDFAGGGRGCDGGGARLREEEYEKPLQVISVPHEHAPLFNKAASELQSQLKAIGCYTISNPTALAMSKQIQESRRSNQEGCFAERPPQKSPSLGEVAAARLLRQKEEESQAASFFPPESLQAERELDEEARRQLESLSVSDLVCVAGPSPQELRERRQLGIQQMQQQQMQQMQQQQMQQQQMQQMQQQHMQQMQQMTQQPQYAYPFQPQQEETSFVMAGAAGEAVDEAAFLEIPDGYERQWSTEEALSYTSEKAAQEPQLHQKLEEQRRRIENLQRRLMDYQQLAAEQGRRTAKSHSSSSSTTRVLMPRHGGGASAGPLSPLPHLTKTPSGPSAQRKPPLAGGISSGAGASREEARRASSDLSQGLSSQSGGDSATKSIDEALASFLERRSLDEATFRRVRSGVYFYGRTKLLIKFDNQGRLVCLPQHQGLGLLVKQQRYQLLEKFLLHQRRAEAAAASQPQDSDG